MKYMINHFVSYCINFMKDSVCCFTEDHFIIVESSKLATELLLSYFLESDSVTDRVYRTLIKDRLVYI